MHSQYHLFREALEAANADELRRLLQSDPTLLHATPEDQLPPLHFAAQEDRIEVADLLLENRADSRFQDLFGGTALHLAVEHDPPSIARLLVRAGADIEAQTICGERPLHFAAQHDNAAAVALLLDHGADVNARANRGWTPLHYAAHHGSPEAGSMLIVRGGADREALDSDDMTPLCLAATSVGTRGWAVLGMLLQYGAILQLYPAIRLGMTHIVRCLLRDNPALLQTDPNALDFISYAVIDRRTDLIQALIECGADVNARRHAPLSLIETMSIYDSDEALPVLRLLLTHGADPNRKTRPEDESPLEWAHKNAPHFVEVLSKE